MQKISRKTILVAVLIGALFLASRIWILQHPPCCYSDVSHDYERYANMWRYGLPPYRKQLFEYPPAAVPLMAIPLEVDQAGIGKYYLNYRVQIFLLESIFFTILTVALFRSRAHRNQKLLAVAFYLAAGMLAKDFWYEGLDLVFFGSFAVMLALIGLVDQKRFWARVITWGLFWLSVAIKLVTAPLALPLFLTKKLPWKHEILASGIGGLIVWGVPLALYRSSLQVFLWFHAQRPIKYGAFASYIIELINDFTKTEHRIDMAPDFAMAGPISQVVTHIIKIAFPSAMIGFLLYAAYVLWKKKFSKKLLPALSLLYIFVFFLTTKTFSSPFHLWYVPLLMLYPFRSLRQQLTMYGLALVMLLLDTTPLVKVPNVPAFLSITLPHIRDAFRFLPMFVFVWWALAEVGLIKQGKHER